MSKLIATSQSPSRPEPSSAFQQFFATFKRTTAIHRVRLIAGRYTNLRRLITWPLLIACFLTPWLSWNDLPLVHLDLVAKQFRFADIIFWPEDLMVLTWMMMAGAFGLFFVAMASGRLWCGFSCPQTVWTFLFIRLEEVIEGSRHKRLKMDRTPWGMNKVSWQKGLRKGLKHSSWIALSIATGITFIAYFYPLTSMAQDIMSSDFLLNEMSGSGVFWILFIASLTYLNAGFLREQVCTHMCPYSRFQSVMADRSTLTVQYDEQRNDCIDCNVCVQVCPTDIDIRDGMQLACIACGACVDGCNDIMEKINKPTGLIAYRPAESTTKQALNLIERPRLLGYALAFLLSCFLIITEWDNRELVNASLERDRNSLYRVNVNDEVENNYAIKLHNKSQQAMQVRLELIPKAQAPSKILPKFNLSQETFSLAPGQRQQYPFTVSISAETRLKSNKEPLEFNLVSVADNQIVGSLNTSFIAPR